MLKYENYLVKRGNLIMDEIMEIFKNSLYHGTTHVIIPVILLCGVVGAILVYIQAKLDRLADKIALKRRIKRNKRRK